MSLTDQKVNLQYVGVIFLTVLLTWLFHEFTHWLTGELFGYKSSMRLNSTAYLEDDPPAGIRAIVSISGPIFTLLQGVAFYFILKNKGWNKLLYPALITAFVMRLLAGIMNFIGPNDEARVGMYLGIGKHTISLIFCAFLFALVYKISRTYQLKTTFQVWTVVIMLVAITILIFVDQIFKFRLI